MIRNFSRSVLVMWKKSSRSLCKAIETEDDSKPWLDPWGHALPRKSSTLTSVEEVDIDWSYVERLMPHEVVPPLPRHKSYPTPSSWQPPRDPPPDLPYYIRRNRDHTLPLYLSLKKDLLNEETLDIDHVELVTMRGIDGDVFACDADLRKFLASEFGKTVATHVDELKGRIVIKGADRSLIEKFLFAKGF